MGAALVLVALVCGAGVVVAAVDGATDASAALAVVAGGAQVARDAGIPVVRNVLTPTEGAEVVRAGVAVVAVAVARALRIVRGAIRDRGARALASRRIAGINRACIAVLAALDRAEALSVVAGVAFGAGLAVVAGVARGGGEGAFPGRLVAAIVGARVVVVAHHALAGAGVGGIAARVRAGAGVAAGRGIRVGGAILEHDVRIVCAPEGEHEKGDARKASERVHETHDNSPWRIVPP